MRKNNYYYNIADDLAKYPDAWAYFAWSGRSTGKTYSTLKYMLDEDRRFIFLKRTVEDVKLMLAGSGKIGSKISIFGADMSPFKAINRDTGENIRAFSIYKGYLGGFWRCDQDNQPEGQPIGYVIALSSIAKVKGFDLSDADYLIFDEFIPVPGERVDRQEGKQLLDLYMTIARDREHRGKPPLKLIGLANPTEINCPVFQELEIADAAADMDAREEEYKYERGIVMHRILMGNEFKEEEARMAVMQAMEGTAWRAMSAGESFAYNDTAMIERVSLKGFRCILAVKYRKQTWYIYQRDDLYYVCSSAGQPRDGIYNLNFDKDVRAFYREFQMELKWAYVDGCVKFQRYTMFDVLINYKKFFPQV